MFQIVIERNLRIVLQMVKKGSQTELASITSIAKVEDFCDQAHPWLAKEHPILLKDYERILSLEEAESAESNLTWPEIRLYQMASHRPMADWPN